MWTKYKTRKWDEHTAGYSAMPALTMQSTENCSRETNTLRCVHCPKKQANKNKIKTVSCVKVLWQDSERIIFKDKKKWYFEPS